MPLDDLNPKAECYIDDKFVAFLESDMARGRAILPFLLDLIGRPVHSAEPVPRDDLLSLKKFLAEATPAKRQIILGWVVDARQFLIELPQHKVKGWQRELRRLRKAGHASDQELETLIGRLDHIGYIMPAARHFLGRIRQAKHAAHFLANDQAQTPVFRQVQSQVVAPVLYQAWSQAHLQAVFLVLRIQSQVH
jgi:hypothetical protein